VADATVAAVLDESEATLPVAPETTGAPGSEPTEQA
jgi:hypothetical protein